MLIVLLLVSLPLTLGFEGGGAVTGIIVCLVFVLILILLVLLLLVWGIHLGSETHFGMLILWVLDSVLLFLL